MVKNPPSKTLNKMQSTQSLRARASQPTFSAVMAEASPAVREHDAAESAAANWATAERLQHQHHYPTHQQWLEREQRLREDIAVKGLQLQLQKEQRASLPPFDTRTQGSAQLKSLPQEAPRQSGYNYASFGGVPSSASSSAPLPMASSSIPSGSSNIDATYPAYYDPVTFLAAAPYTNPHTTSTNKPHNYDNVSSLFDNFTAEMNMHQQQLDSLKANFAKQYRVPSTNTVPAPNNVAMPEAPEKINGGGEEYKLKGPEAYTKPFLNFMTSNPTVFHAVNHFEEQLKDAGFKKLSERNAWNEDLVKGGKYFLNRNGSSLIAFTIGGAYKSGNGVAMVGAHVDALTARLKPISNKKTTAGYVQLGVAPYAGGLNSTWWDRDLGIGGRVIVKDAKTGKITTKLVKLDYPIAKIPTLAPHFGVGMLGQENKETQTVPIIGLDNSDLGAATEEFANLTLGGAGSFAATQPPKLVRAIAGELSITDYSTILNWELELFDTQPAQVGGLEKEFIFAGRIDDKVCSWAALEGLLAASTESSEDDGIIKLVGLFDDEEIGSKLRQGAWSNFLPSVIERITEAFAPSGTVSGANLLSQTYANSFLVSADVTHAVNPNFLSLYLENHAPRLNVGLCIAADSNGHMTTDSVSTTLLTRCAAKSGNTLQVFMIRNDSRSGGTIGPDLSSLMGVRSIDAGIPQLSMHSIRATIGNLDPGLGVRAFAGFFNEFESVDKEFSE